MQPSGRPVFSKWLGQADLPLKVNGSGRPVFSKWLGRADLTFQSDYVCKILLIVLISTVSWSSWGFWVLGEVQELWTLQQSSAEPVKTCLLALSPWSAPSGLGPWAGFYWLSIALLLGSYNSCSSPRRKGSPPSNFDSAQLVGFWRQRHFEKSGLPDLYFNAGVRQTCLFKLTGSSRPAFHSDWFRKTCILKVTWSGRPAFQSDWVRQTCIFKMTGSGIPDF